MKRKAINPKISKDGKKIEVKDEFLELVDGDSIEIGGIELKAKLPKGAKFVGPFMIEIKEVK